MYGFIRLVFGGLLFLCFCFVIRKLKPVRRLMAHLIAAGLCMALTVGLGFIPVENLFVTFDSPEAAYEYCHGKADVVLVVEGSASDYVIERKNAISYQYSLIPKTEDGWKVGVGFNSRTVVFKLLDDGTFITVERYKNTEDYFISVRGEEGKELTITDAFNTKFYPLEGYHPYFARKDISYYAYIPNFNEQYSIVINGNEIPLGNGNKG